jgi:AAA+ ATPase superfamily predicted ATPase
MGTTYDWAAVADFVGRDAELDELDRWWKDPDPTPVSLYGRRRCGKSWLSRRFAHGKPAVILVARRTAPGTQLADFADRLEPVLGVRPDLSSLQDLFRVIYRAAREHRTLVVIDEFPYLLPTTEVEIDRELSAIAAVMEEERDESRLKLILCGSLVSQMESLLAERGPLHGRLRPLQLQPLVFSEARAFLTGLEPLSQFERFAIAGGMPRYLTALGSQDSLDDVLCQRVLNPNSALWDEGRAVLEQELREPKVYFSLLEELSTGDKRSAELAAALRSDAQRLSKYLHVLESMRLIRRRVPIGVEPNSRNGQWHLLDPFLRFWFRFVFPFQDDLESGLPGRRLYATEVEPTLNSHVAGEFEEFCRGWTRATQPVTTVGSWWGASLHELRRSGTRSTEEIDVVGRARGRVTLIGEARWRNSQMDLDYVQEIEDYKLSALRQSGLKVTARPTILLFSRGGYSPALRAAADERDDLVLVDVVEALQRD